MADNKLSEIIATSLGSIKELADANTIVGEPITTSNGTVVIPISKVSVGFASGGLDYYGKDSEKKADGAAANGNGKPSGRQQNFGGGGGTGLTVSPICFLVIRAEGDVELLNIASPNNASPAVGIIETVSSFIERSPDIISRIKATFGKDGAKQTDGETAKTDAPAD